MVLQHRWPHLRIPCSSKNMFKVGGSVYIQTRITHTQRDHQRVHFFVPRKSLMKLLNTHEEEHMRAPHRRRLKETDLRLKCVVGF